jgi:hypothetical protein
VNNIRDMKKDKGIRNTLPTEDAATAWNINVWLIV